MIFTTQKGMIGDAVHRELLATLGDDAVRSAPDPNGGQAGDLFVGAIDSGRLDRLVRWERQALDRGMRFLPIQVQGAEAIIGPEIAPGRPGCLACWATRYLGARRHGRYCAQHGDASEPDTGSPWLAPWNATMLGILAARLLRLRGADEHPVEVNGFRFDRCAYYLDLRTLTGKTWPIAPDSSCPVCSRLPDDTPERAHVEVEDREKREAHGDRLRRLSDLAAVRREYVGYRSNIVSNDFINWNFTCGAVVSVTVSLTEDRRPEPCSGFCANYDDASTVAVLEGLERYAGVRPRRTRSSVRGSVASRRPHTVDPRLFGLHAPEEYAARPEFLTPYSEELELDFVWAYSFAQQRSVLLPEQLAYYSLGAPRGSTFLIEGSIGCALGSSEEECILHGIFEVVERDAFLLTWYAQLASAHVDILECADPEVRYRYRHLRAEGFEVFGLDITTDYAIPALCVLARRREPEMPFAFCIGAAHARPEMAIKKALRELTAVLCRYRIELQDEGIKRRAMALAEDPTQVRSMSDHALLFCVPSAGRHLEFLIDSSKRTSLAEIDEAARDLQARNLGVELTAAIGRVLATGSDVLVVKQTPPEVAANDLQICKTLITNAIPMTWGRHRRLEGLRRLHDLTSRPNPVPHPYP